MLLWDTLNWAGPLKRTLEWALHKPSYEKTRCWAHYKGGKGIPHAARNSCSDKVLISLSVHHAMISKVRIYYLIKRICDYNQWHCIQLGINNLGLNVNVIFTLGNRMCSDWQASLPGSWVPMGRASRLGLWDFRSTRSRGPGMLRTRGPTVWREKLQETIRQLKLTPNSVSVWLAKYRKEPLAPGLTVLQI